MKTFKQFVQENTAIFQSPKDPRTNIVQIYNYFTGFEPGEIVDSQDLLIKLRDLLDDILSGKKY